MKLSDSREKLLADIDGFILNSNPDRLKKIEEEVLHDGKISLGNFMKIVSGRSNLGEMSDAELYWIASAISRASDRFSKPEEYFEDAEIRNYKFFDPEENRKKTFPLVFRNVSKLAENQYLFPLSVGEIKELKNENILQIIPELQRNHKKDKYGDLKTKVNKHTAQQISALINDGAFFYNGIRFNLMDDGECDSPLYDEEERTLTISNGIIIVPDGNHRTISCELATKHLDDKFGVFFTYFSAQKTRLLLNQEWTTVPIPKRHKDAMKPTVANKIVDAIMRSQDADDLYVKGIVKDGTEIRANNGFILYIELATAIQRYYDTESLERKADQDELRDWLITYMNYLTKLLQDDFQNYKKVKRHSWSTHYLAWHYYIMISKCIYGDPDWRIKLENIIENTDFTNQEIREFFVTTNRRKIYDFCSDKEGSICTTQDKSNHF